MLTRPDDPMPRRLWCTEQVLEQMVECGAATDVGHASITPYTVLIRACGKVRGVPSTHARHPTLLFLSVQS